MKGKYCIFTFILILIIFLPLASGCAESVSATDTFGAPKQETTAKTNGKDVVITQKNIIFDGGDFFWIRRYEFSGGKGEPYIQSFSIKGTTLDVQYAEAVDGKRVWRKVGNKKQLPATTLFISTDKSWLIIGIPAVYKAQVDYGNLEAVPTKENPVQITKAGDKFNIAFRFPKDKRYIGEIWALQSQKQLFTLDEKDKRSFLNEDLSGKWRMSLEGFYQKSYENYVPTGPNTYFRQTTCYTGGTLIRSRTSSAAHDIGYAFTKISASNQNSLGYWETPAASEWLLDDFGITSGFYDTRFNADFVTNLMDANLVYGKNADGSTNTFFLDKAKKYADFYIDYVSKFSYKTENGVLVQDYANIGKSHRPTHVSLNHHLAGLNTLLRVYKVTGDERYLATANSMALGIQDTEKQWILPDNNLKYALYYNGKRELNDYPYLTYNDLYFTKSLLEKLSDVPTDSIDHLMHAKKQWMDANQVKGYLGYQSTMF